MEKEKNNWEKIFEDNLFDDLQESKTVVDIHLTMVNILDLTERSQNPRVLEKIGRCLDVVKDSQKDLKLRESILLRVSHYLYPFFEEEEYQEEITTEGIKNVANSLGGIIDSHPEDNDVFADTCKNIFIKTINLEEKNNNGKL